MVDHAVDLAGGERRRLRKLRRLPPGLSGSTTDRHRKQPDDEQRSAREQSYG
jgi:hypothetical protein